MLPHRDSRVVRIILILFFLLALGYALYEARGLVYGPVVHVPHETMTVREQFISVQGRAERITELRLNGRPIPVTEDGAFDEPYLLAAGSNHLIFEARDARGRTTMKTLDIVYLPPAGEETTPNFPAPAAPTTSPATTTESD